MNLNLQTKRVLPALLAAASAIGFSAVNLDAAALRQASVTESFHTVSYQAGTDAPQKAATPGTIINPSNIVRTGVDSRAELQFNDKTVTRMGANSVFSFDEKTQTMDLSQGSVLFCKPKNSDTFQIATPAATCSISGTTGFAYVYTPKIHAPKTSTPTFAQLHPASTLLFGLIEGKTSITIGGKTYPLSAGELLVSTGGLVRVVEFNIVSFLKKAGLLTGFKSTLPNATEIADAANRFASLSRRGFIEPTAFSFAFNSNQLQLLENFVSNDGNTQPLPQLAGQIQGSQFLASQIPQGGVGGAGAGSGSGGGFVNVGGTGVIHGQLIWNLDVDLDLHLILPPASVSQGVNNVVGYANRTVTQTTGAVATLDTDDQGSVNGPGTERVENIVVSGTPATGTYQFYGIYYADHTGNSSATPVPYTLTVSGNSGATTQVYTGTLTQPGGNSGQSTTVGTVVH